MRMDLNSLDLVIDTLRRDIMRADPVDVAEATGLHLSTLYKLMRGTNKVPRIKTFLLLCDYFGYEVKLKTMMELVERAA